MWLERDDTKRKADQGCNRMRRCVMPADRARLSRGWICIISTAPWLGSVRRWRRRARVETGALKALHCVEQKLLRRGTDLSGTAGLFKLDASCPHAVTRLSCHEGVTGVFLPEGSHALCHPRRIQDRSNDVRLQAGDAAPAFVSRARPFILRRKTINCCRRAAFSASSRLFNLNGDPRIVSTKRISAIISPA